MLRSLVLCLVLALGLAQASGAQAESWRLPKTGDPAFLVDAPAAWSVTYDTLGNLQFLTADHSAFVQVSMLTDPKVATTPESEIASQILASAALPAFSRTAPGSIGGLAGQSFISTASNNGVAMTIVLTIVKIDASHAACLGTIARDGNTAEQTAALDALVAKIQIVGR